MAADPSAEIAGFEWIEFLGSGSCGEVWRVRRAGDTQGPDLALKRLSAMAVNRRLLAHGTARLEGSEGHHGVATVVETEFDRRPFYVVTPLLGRQGETHWESVTLNHALSEAWSFDQVWLFLGQLAAALSWMHTRGVAHCNLTPGNIMLQGGEGGELPEPMLVDYCQGWVGGIYHLDPSDTLLYAPPEQLLHPELVDEGGATRWDVYAFGVIGWRLLHGRFPRLEAEFSKAEQIFHRQIKDLEAIRPDELAAALNSMPIPKPALEEAASEGQAALYELLLRCISLDPEKRPSDMRLVLAELEQIEFEWRQRKEAAALELEREMARRQRRGLAFLSGLLALLLFGAIGYGVLSTFRLKQATDELSDEQIGRADQVAQLDSTIEQNQAEAEEQLAGEVARRNAARVREQVASTSLARAHQVSNVLLETVGLREPPEAPGFREHPLLLQRLEDYYRDFQSELDGSDLLLPELARTRESLALLAAARDDQASEEQYLRLALRDWIAVAELNPDSLDVRRALARIRIALARHNLQHGELDLALDLARSGDQIAAELAGRADAEGEDILRHAEGLALLGQVQRENGDPEAALARLAQASEVLASVGDELYLRNQALVRSGSLLAHRGETLLDLERRSDARDTLASALEVLQRTLEEHPDWDQSKVDKALVLTQLARLAEHNGNLEYANQALKQSQDLLVNLENSAEVFELRAESLRALAMSERNFGRSEEALELMRRSLETWQQLTAMQPEVLAHRLSYAIALWDAGTLSEQYEQLNEAIELTRRAVRLAEELATESEIGPMLSHRARFALGEFQLDLGYLLAQVDGKEEEVRQSLQSSVAVLEKLVQDFPEDEDARDILEVARERLANLD